MSLEIYLGFVLAAAIIIVIPGPNVTLIIANSLAQGTRGGLLTVAGTSLAIAGQLLITAFGVLSVLALLSEAFVWLRWIGVAYLVYLGVKAWRSCSDLSIEPNAKPKSEHRLFWQGFLISATNPKTILF